MNINFRDHVSSGNFVRVWCDNWAGDQFEIMHREDFETMQNLLRSMGSNISFTDRNGDDD